MKKLDIIFGILRIPLDFLMVLLACFVAYYSRYTTDLLPGISLPITADTFPEISLYLTESAIGIIFFLIVQILQGAYRLKKPYRLDQQFSQIFFSSTIWLFGIITFYFLIRSFPFSRLVLVHSWFFAIIFCFIARFFLQTIQNFLYKKGISQNRILLIGNANLSSTIIKYLQKNPRNKILGYCDFIENNQTDLPWLGSPAELPKIIQGNKVDQIIQTKKNLTENEELDLLEFCRENLLEFSFIPTETELRCARTETETIGRIPLIHVKSTSLDGWGRVLKRTFDLISSGILIILFSPIMLIIAILIKIDDRKSTIFFKFLDDGSRVKRVGYKGNLFHFYKFRTMIPNSHNLRYTDLAHLNSREGTPMVKIKNDPRITKIGAFLRKTSLDELPQLFNVFKGEMSLVGPRPHLPEEVAKYRGHHRFVLTVKPGITGMAQISGRSDLNFEDEVKLDSIYIENWSLLLDIKILLKTALVLFQKYEE